MISENDTCPRCEEDTVFCIGGGEGYDLFKCHSQYCGREFSQEADYESIPVIIPYYSKWWNDWVQKKRKGDY
jgi:hypothetical protein